MSNIENRIAREQEVSPFRKQDLFHSDVLDTYSMLAAERKANIAGCEASAKGMNQALSIYILIIYALILMLPTKAYADKPSNLYDTAFEKLKNSQYHDAEKDFENFLKLYADHELAANAKYWIGKSQYVRGLYSQAIETFSQGYKQYPNSVKGPDYLLSLGLAQKGLGRTSLACSTFGELLQSFKHAHSDILDRAASEAAELDCIIDGIKSLVQVKADKQIVRLPDGSKIAFPADMSKDEIRKITSKHWREKEKEEENYRQCLVTTLPKSKTRAATFLYTQACHDLSSSDDQIVRTARCILKSKAIQSAENDEAAQLLADAECP